MKLHDCRILGGSLWNRGDYLTAAVRFINGKQLYLIRGWLFPAVLWPETYTESCGDQITHGLRIVTFIYNIWRKMNGLAEQIADGAQRTVTFQTHIGFLGGFFKLNGGEGCHAMRESAGTAR